MLKHMFSGRTGQRGATLVWVTGAMLVMLLIAGMAIELGRALVERERLKTASEAGVLAGALQAIPWIQVTVPQSRYDCTTSPGPDGKPKQDCQWDYRDIPLRGPEADVVPNWRSMAGCGDGWTCPRAPTINCRGVTFPGGTQAVMTDAFERNTRKVADLTSTLGAMSTNDQTGTTRLSAAGKLKVQLLRLAGLKDVAYIQRSIGKAEVRDLRGWPVGQCS